MVTESEEDPLSGRSPVITEEGGQNRKGSFLEHPHLKRILDSNPPDESHITDGGTEAQRCEVTGPRLRRE